jgi:hypothetical protein
VKEDFIKDCNYNLVNFEVQLATEYFKTDEKKLVSIFRFNCLYQVEIVKILEKENDVRTE